MDNNAKPDNSKVKRILLTHAQRICYMDPELVKCFVAGLDLEGAINYYQLIRGGCFVDENYIREKYIILYHICERHRIRIPHKNDVN